MFPVSLLDEERALRRVVWAAAGEMSATVKTPAATNNVVNFGENIREAFDVADFAPTKQGSGCANGFGLALTFCGEKTETDGHGRGFPAATAS